MSLAALNVVLLTLVFRGQRQEGEYFTCLASSWKLTRARFVVVMTKAGLGTPAEDGGLASGNLYRQIFPIRTVWLLAAFALIYIGVEVTLGGGCMFVKTAPTRPLTRTISQDGSSPT